MKGTALLAYAHFGAAAVLSGSGFAPLSNIRAVAPANNDDALYALPTGFHEEPDIDQADPRTPGATVKKMRYGPFSLGANSVISNRPVLNVPVPCTECTVVAYQAGLEDASGNSLNVDTGDWLHHMVLYVLGSGHRDTSCALPNQRIFASGNERAVTRLNDVYKYGFNIKSGDRFMSIIELMNMGSQARNYYMTILYEYMPTSSASASGYTEYAAMPWLDATGCGASDVPAREGSYDVAAVPWRSTVRGRLLFAEGHLHDGGLNTTITLNGKPVCVSQHLYGRKPEFVAKDMSGSMASGGSMVSISDTSSCIDFGDIEVGDTLTASCHYDTSQHPIEKNPNGSLMAIMCNTRVYIAPRT